MRRVLLPAAIFVAAYSWLPHKELRFVIYAVPLINIAAATALEHWYNDAARRSRAALPCVHSRTPRFAVTLLALRHRHRLQRHSVVHRLIWWASLAMLAASAVTTAGLLWVSMWNYPGGAAVQRLPTVLAGHSMRTSTAAAMQPSPAFNM